MNLSAKVRLQELERIAEMNGGLLHAEDVVEAAKNEKNPLHKSFEWNDQIAGQEYRLELARKLIRITVEYIEQAPESPVKVFVSLQSDRNKEGCGYRFISDVLGDEDMSRELLEEALEDMKFFRENIVDSSCYEKCLSQWKSQNKSSQMS